jgi:hypothetical protein
MTAPLTLRVPFMLQTETSLPRHPGPAGVGEVNGDAAPSGGLVAGKAVLAAKGSAAAACEVFRFGLEADASGVAVAAAASGVAAAAASGVAAAAESGVAAGRAGDQRGRSPPAAVTTLVGASRPTSSRRP